MTDNKFKRYLCEEQFGGSHIFATCNFANKSYCWNPRVVHVFHLPCQVMQTISAMTHVIDWSKLLRSPSFSLTWQIWVKLDLLEVHCVVRPKRVISAILHNEIPSKIMPRFVSVSRLFWLANVTIPWVIFINKHGLSYPNHPFMPSWDALWSEVGGMNISRQYSISSKIMGK